MVVTEEGRNDLATLFTGTGAEIGVEQGAFSERICQHADKLYCIDAWRAYRGYRDHTRQEKLDRFYEITRQRLPHNAEIVRKFSADALHLFPDESLDFVYIDANHSLEHAFFDIVSWARKVKPGGIVAGDDYMRRKGQERHYDVPGAVQLYCQYTGRDFVVWRGGDVPNWSFTK